MSIHFHIERLVLEGLPLTGREMHHFEVAFCEQLRTLLRTDALPAALSSGGAYPKLRAEAIRFSAEGAAASVGQQSASSVYGALQGK